jgi:preprotein translocase subunit SecD
MNLFPRWKIVLIFLITVVLIFFALPNFFDKKLKYFPNTHINYGLDLQGGVQILLKVDFDEYLKGQLDVLTDVVRKSLRKDKINYKSLKTKDKHITFSLINEQDIEKAEKAIAKINRDLVFSVNKDTYNINLSFSDSRVEQLKDTIVEQSREIIRHRIDETGTLEPSIQRQGKLGILLQVPGLTDPAQLKSILGRTAKLSFHLVNEVASVDKALQGAIPQDSLLLQGEGDFWYLIYKKNILTGDLLTDAQLSHNQHSQPTVSFTFNTLGAKLFGDATRQYVGKRIAIVLDNKVISAPSINEPIVTGSGQISGNFTVSSANELALLLRAGSLPAPLNIMEEKTVGPSLGEDSIKYGKSSAIIGICVVILFMLIIYGILGAFASIALVCNILFIIAIMGILNATLTMTGIAGIVLTIGMAVDTNILIFERIREELKNKATVKYAVKKGFEQAFATILDSNITTLIAALFLYIFGSGLVRGFAVTLAIGILSSMFSAITLTKLFIFKWIDLKYKPPK